MHYVVKQINVTTMGMHVIVGLLHYNFLCYVTCKFGVANVAWLVTPNLYMFKSSGIILCRHIDTFIQTPFLDTEYWNSITQGGGSLPWI